MCAMTTCVCGALGAADAPTQTTEGRAGALVPATRRWGGSAVVEGQLLSRYRWARAARLGCCRTGLHFLARSDRCDAYACACRRIILGAEHIR